MKYSFDAFCFVCLFEIQSDIFILNLFFHRISTGSISFYLKKKTTYILFNISVAFSGVTLICLTQLIIEHKTKREKNRRNIIPNLF